MFKRLFFHMITQLDFRQFFSEPGLKKIKSLIHEGEIKHAGQVRFVAEYAFNIQEVFQKKSSRDKASQIFSDLRIWDTEENCGVLLYLLIAERKIEIFVDRGIAKKVPNSYWQEICSDLQKQFKKKKFENGTLEALRKINEVLIRFYPTDKDNIEPNELPDSPVIIR